MLPVIVFAYNLFGFLYHLLKKTNHEKEDDCDTEQRVAEQNMQLEVEELPKQPLEALRPDTPDIPRNASSFLCTGVITDVEYPNILIDERVFFDISSCALSLNLDDKITYSGYKNEFDMIVVTRILENHGTVCESWNDTKVEESNLKNIDHVIVAEVDYRKERLVYLKDNDLKFSLVDVKGTMVPIAGDWLELKCVVQLDEDKPRNIAGSQELKVVSYQPLRRGIKSAVVTEGNGAEGTCDRLNYFDEQSLTNSFDSPVGQEILIEAIESNQGACALRDMKLVPTEEKVVSKMFEVHNTPPIESNQGAWALPTEERDVSKMFEVHNTPPIEGNQGAYALPTEERDVSKMFEVHNTPPIESNQGAYALPTEERDVSKMFEVHNTPPIESNQGAYALPTEKRVVSKKFEVKNTSPIESNQGAWALPTEERVVSKMFEVHNTLPIESNQGAWALPTEERVVSKMFEVHNTPPIESNQGACALPTEERVVSKMFEVHNTPPIESNQGAYALPTEERDVSKMFEVHNTPPIESNQGAYALPTEERVVSKKFEVKNTSPIESNQGAWALPTEERVVSKMFEVHNTLPIESNQGAWALPTEERVVSKMFEVHNTPPIESNQGACALPTEERVVSKMFEVHNTPPIESNQGAYALPTEERDVSKMFEVHNTSPIESNQGAWALPTEERDVSKMFEVHNTSPIESNQGAWALPTEERDVSKMFEVHNTSPIESNQGAWALPTEERDVSKIFAVINTSPEDSSLLIKKEMGLEITDPIKFDKVYKLYQTLNKQTITVHVTNRSNEVQLLLKWIVPGSKKSSQMIIDPVLARPRKLYPDQTFSFRITCNPKILGVTKESIIFLFKSCKIERVVEINVVDEDWSEGNIIQANDYPTSTYKTRVAQMNRVRQNPQKRIVHAPRPVKTRHFASTVKLGKFPIPDIVWSAILGDPLQVVRYPDFEKVISQIKNKLPCLTQDLNINNYTDRWHNLLFIEEIHENISLRVYDKPNTCLINCQEFLGLEITGLSERRPSLVIGDRAIVEDICDNRPIRYEGYIQGVKSDLILMKFQTKFHESYSGSEVSIEFQFSRTRYRRAHEALNLAISNLGQEILFPTTLLPRENQLPSEEINSIEWFNRRLNDTQKAAVSNILLGQCRPKPYLIYGPPGTGKTITVIEAILQILKLLPDSRILVATPSNSSSNLITERLIDYKESITNSFIRVVAHYLLETDNIPPVVKPYCATIDMAFEDTDNSDYRVLQADGVNVRCGRSFIERQRVIIGTCSTLGTLTQMALPMGHFTHIIVDEAGQVTEPEIMIALTFADKVNGQIILAGDPMQLGPVVTSLYATELGMSVSYLCRLLETLPYQKDFAVFQNGFNEKMVTKLYDNYRSLKEVITLPNQMFYDGSLVPNINRSQPWIERIVKVMNNIFDLANSDSTGGIYVNGIRGENVRAEESPSWYNPDEASMVAMTTSKLYESNITADEIGIITPYIAQRKHLRMVFKSLRLPVPKIGTVEEFQGQEKPLIIISTVRSSSSLLEDDRKNQLHFVKNPKRLNVALTRAQVAVLLVCDPYVLCTDPLWAKVINQAVNDAKYMGCDLPNMTYTT